MATVTFRDETATGKPVAAWGIAGLPERMTVRELIRLRVREEVARHNSRPSTHFNGLVRPDDAEVELNGYRLREPRRIDWQRQATPRNAPSWPTASSYWPATARSRTWTKSWT
ncbi:hypothetical protein ACWGJX_34835 [Streptomyces sp. NPDC054775]